MSFGADYQKEAEDANEGRIQQKSTAAITSSRDTSSQQVVGEKVGGKNKDLIDLVAFTASTLSGINKKQDIVKYNEAYSEGSQEALDKLNNEQSPILKFLFGKTATLRGFQQRVIDDEVENDFQSRLGTMEADVRKYSTIEQYKKEVADPRLQAALEKQTDPEIKTSITNAFTKNTKQLAGQFAKHRRLYEQVLNRKAVQTSILTASRTVQQATTTGEDHIVEDANKKLRQALTKPEDMDDIAWEDTMVTSVISRISNGDIGLLQVLEADGKVETMSPENQEDLRTAKEGYTIANDERFLTQGTNLNQMIATQDAQFANSLAAYKKQYPQVNLNEWRARFDKQAEKAAVKARTIKTNASLIVSKDPRAAALEGAAASAAWNEAVDQMGRDLAQGDREEVIKNQRINGDVVNDINVAYTKEEKEAALMKSPTVLVNNWRAAGKQPPIVNSAFQELDSLILADELDENDEQRVDQLLDFMNHFNTTPEDRGLFAKGVKSKQALANYKQLSFLKGRTGAATRKSLILMRNNRDRDLVELDTPEVRDLSNEALREFTDENGFEYLGFWSVDPDNQEELQLAAQGAFEEAYAITKNTTEAKNLVQDFLTYDSTRIGDKFILGGAELDSNSYNNNFDSYVQKIQNFDAWKDKQEQAGFPRDRLITDEENTITVLPNKQGIVITSRDEDGNTIYVDLLAPQNQLDFLEHPPTRGQSEPLDFNEPVPPADPTSVPNDTTQQTPVVESILKEEGGLSLKKSDRGNFNSKGELVGTNFGISAEFLERKLGRVPTKQDVENITREQAAKWHQESIDTEIAAVKKSTNKEVLPEAELLLSHMVTLTSRKGVSSVLRKLPNNATPEQMAKEYLTYLRTLSAWKANGKGWTARVEAILKQN